MHTLNKSSHVISYLRALQKLINTSNYIGFEMGLDFIRNWSFQRLMEQGKQQSQW